MAERCTEPSNSIIPKPSIMGPQPSTLFSGFSHELEDNHAVQIAGHMKSPVDSKMNDKNNRSSSHVNIAEQYERWACGKIIESDKSQICSA
jgi:hypothetical protein